MKVRLIALLAIASLNLCVVGLAQTDSTSTTPSTGTGQTGTTPSTGSGLGTYSVTRGATRSGSVQDVPARTTQTKKKRPVNRKKKAKKAAPAKKSTDTANTPAK